MHYFSTNRKSPPVPFREATLNGQPDDGGLYSPKEIPRLSKDFLTGFSKKTNTEIAFEVIHPYVGDSIPDDVLFKICSETVDFPFPLVPITENISALELFHGPTLAFKDVGARFMSRCLGYFSRETRGKTIVVVATSGDTGGAVANGFFGVDGVDVVILYPKGKVSKVQEQQLATLGENITALEVSGTFDDCQDLAKRALADHELRRRAFLTSANSINIARWLPQQFYYFYALKQWQAEAPVISVPSGNFGNLAAGMLANVSGLPVRKFIAACNANDVVPEFFRTGQFNPKAAVPTLSNAMDVGNPSNFVRILEIFNGDVSALTENIEATSKSDDETAETMRAVYEKYGYVLDPHGAVAFRALADYLESHRGESGIFLETAHPVKFDSVKEIVGTYGREPGEIDILKEKNKNNIEIPIDYTTVKEILLNKL